MRTAAGFILAGVFALALPASAGAVAGNAETYVVNSTADGAPNACDATQCTLREALLMTDDDGHVVADRIEISLSGFDNTITLGSDLPLIDEPLEIVNTGVFGSSVSGANAFRPFRIDQLTPGNDVSISGVAIFNGSDDSTGGAIQAVDTDLTLSNAFVLNSKTTTEGDDGGGISVNTGSLTLQNSTVSGNSTLGNSANGGGIFVNGGLTITRSTISGNETNGENSRGGGIFATGAFTHTIESSTVSGNHTDQTTGVPSQGGGLAIGTGSMAILNSTFTGNFTQGLNAGGGNIFSSAANPDPVLTNTIVANGIVSNTVAPQRDLGSDGDLFDLNYSLVEFAAGAPLAADDGTNLLGLDPQLAGLASNGGATMTHLPASTSPVVDKGDTAEATDQRGSARPVDLGHVANGPGGDGADIGAVELTTVEGPPPPPPPPPQPATGSSGSSSGPPSNAFSFGELERNKRKGTATQVVNVPGVGVLELGGNGVRSASVGAQSAVAVGGPGPVELLIKARGKKKRKLIDTGKVRVTIQVTFTPSGGAANTQTASVKLKRSP